MEQEIKILKIDETIAQSIIKDSFTLVVVALMVYISKDSTFWTIITGLMFILFLLAKICSGMSKTKTFTSTDQVRAWLARIDAERESEK